LTVDWQWIEPAPEQPAPDLEGEGWWGERHVSVSSYPGGAALLGRVLQEVSSCDNESFEVSYPEPPESPTPTDQHYHHSYMSCKNYNKSNQAESSLWRVAKPGGVARAWETPQDSREEDNSDKAKVVVVNDAGLGFRGKEKGRWPAAVRRPGSEEEGPWFVLKMAHPVAEGHLWEHLICKCPERLVVVVAVDALRYGDVHISRGVSWEQTASDVHWELLQNSKAKSLACCAYVVVSFPTVGAFLLSRRRADSDPKEMKPEGRIFFDPEHIEDTWAEVHPGSMVGYTTCMAAAIAYKIATSDQVDIHVISDGVQAGLRAQRALHENGYVERRRGDTLVGLAPPYTAVAKAIRKAVSELQFSYAEMPEQQPREQSSKGQSSKQSSNARPGWWTILKERYKDEEQDKEDALLRVATEIVQEGPEEALKHVPLARFERLVTVDRREIEGYRNVRRLIVDYLQRRTATVPLSIAVLGPPGAGKSFGVRQVARSVSKDIRIIEFNIAQWTDPEELYEALQQVRDEALSGKIPLVLWDEFDCNLGNVKLGWLKYFLAPMQDGYFQRGGHRHPLGRSIFVFVGGQFSSMKELEEESSRSDSSNAGGSKVRDFVSRLKGYVDVIGPDPIPATKSSSEHEEDRGDREDKEYVLRRALVLRNILEYHAPHLFSKRDSKDLPIAPGVLNAFLSIPEYKHGTRSMEAIVTMSLLAGRKRFERSCLPAEAQLDLHVDGKEFLKLAQNPAVGTPAEKTSC